MTQLGDIPTTDDLATTAHIFPTGTVTIWPGASGTVPTGWMLCDGRTLDGTNPAYNPLYDAIGVLYGGTGQNSFKIPGLVASATTGAISRIPVGKHPGGPAAVDACGKTGGSVDHTHGVGSLVAAAHTHTVGSLVSAAHGHGHSLSAPSHAHRARGDSQNFYGGDLANLLCYPAAFQGATGDWPAGYNTGFTQPGVTGGISNASTIGLSGSLANDTITGSSSSDRTITSVSGTSNPPYTAVNYIIKL